MCTHLHLLQSFAASVMLKVLIGGELIIQVMTRLCQGDQCCGQRQDWRAAQMHPKERDCTCGLIPPDQAKASGSLVNHNLKTTKLVKHKGAGATEGKGGKVCGSNRSHTLSIRAALHIFLIETCTQLLTFFSPGRSAAQLAPSESKQPDLVDCVLV